MLAYIAYVCSEWIKYPLYIIRHVYNKTVRWPIQRANDNLRMRISQIKPAGCMSYEEWLERNKWIETAYLARTKQSHKGINQ